MRRSVDRLLRRIPGVRVALLFVAGGLLVHSPGCGGVMLDSGGSKDGPDGSVSVSGGGGEQSSGGASSVAGSSSAGRPGTGGNSGKMVCGDGLRAPAEQCDGPDLGGATCSSASMGAYPFGVLGCTKQCRWDLTRCVGVGVGGATGAGGNRGTGGYPSGADICYDSNGVPGGMGTGGAPTCAYGYVADEICVGRAIPPTGEQCVQICACNSLPGPYMRCTLDAYCAPILACALRAGCRTLLDCETACAPLIDQARAAGPNRVNYADAAITGYMQSCGYPCAAPPPPIGR